MIKANVELVCASYTLRTDRTENKGEPNGKTHARCTFSKRHRHTTTYSTGKKTFSSIQMKCVVRYLCVLCHQNDIEWQKAMTVSGVECLSNLWQQLLANDT